MGFSLSLSRGFFAKHAAFSKSRSGGTAVEFAIIGPVLLLLMSGMFSYGGYFLTAHTIQQLTNDAARAAIAGLDDTERTTLARDAVRSGIAAQAFLRGESMVAVERDGAMLRVRVTYDASEDMYWAFEGLLPIPRPEISRAASIRLGGVP